MSQIQFELWRECNCRCTYCTLGDENKFTSDELKLKSMNTSLDEMSKFKSGQYSVLGFIGGEFFQGQLNTPEIKDTFFKLIKKTNDLLNNNIIEEFWLNASLLIGEQPDFYETIDLIDNKKKLWILTSYDTIGRFHTPKMFNTWEKHIYNIHKLYPDVRINITSILTKDFINKYLNDEFDITEFRRKYNSSLFLKTPVKPDNLINMTNEDINKILGDFFPTREEFLEFFMKFKEREGIEEYYNLFSNDLRADEVRKNYNNDKERNIRFLRDKTTLKEKFENFDTNFNIPLSCGHPRIYQCYTDSENCVICDKLSMMDI